MEVEGSACYLLSDPSILLPKRRKVVRMTKVRFIAVQITCMHACNLLASAGEFIMSLFSPSCRHFWRVI